MLLFSVHFLGYKPPTYIYRVHYVSYIKFHNFYGPWKHFQRGRRKKLSRACSWRKNIYVCVNLTTWRASRMHSSKNRKTKCTAHLLFISETINYMFLCRQTWRTLSLESTVNRAVIEFWNASHSRFHDCCRLDQYWTWWILGKIVPIPNLIYWDCNNRIVAILDDTSKCIFLMDWLTFHSLIKCFHLISISWFSTLSTIYRCSAPCIHMCARNEKCVQYRLLCCSRNYPHHQMR